jgi:hypothetical protein
MKGMLPAAAYVALSLATVLAGCSREVPPAAAATEVKGLVQDTKRYAESLQSQPAGDRIAPEQIAKLTSLMEQLLRHMEERAQASQQGGAVAQADTQVAADVVQLQQVQNTLSTAAAESTPPHAAREQKALLDRISENVAKIIQIAQQGQELVGILRPSRGAGSQTSEALQASAAPAVAPPTDTAAMTTPPSAAALGDTESAAQGVGPGDSGPARQRQLEVQTRLVQSRERCCDVVVNVAMKGRLGRIVVAFPEGGDAGSSRIDVFRAGETASMEAAYGSSTWDLFPGTYAVVISGARVEGVTVQSGHDTRLRVGILRIQAGGSTRADVLAADGKTALVSGYGAMQIGLPVGTYRVQIAGQSEPVTIQNGKITDF